MPQIFGSKELMEDVYNRGLCVSCGMCVELCPYFKSYIGRTSQLFPCDREKGKCYSYCPKTEVNLEELAEKFWGTHYEGSPIGKHHRIIMSRAGAKALKGNFQGGGSVSSIIANALDRRIIGTAVLTGRSGLIGEPTVVTNSNDVINSGGSKFMATPTLSALNKAIREGTGNIGVVGTPCQITAVAQMRCNPMGIENFIDPIALTVGLFCTWAIDTRKFIALVSDFIGDSCILGMDVPPPPAEIMTLDTPKGKKEIPLSLIRPLVLPGCHICPDMTSEWADISVGQVEGEPGWNILIIRTEKGRYAVDAAIESEFLEVRELPIDLLKGLEKAGSNKKKRAVSVAAEKGYLNTSCDNGRAALRIPPAAIKMIVG